jgi:O-antigen ligase
VRADATLDIALPSGGFERSLAGRGVPLVRVLLAPLQLLLAAPAALYLAAFTVFLFRPPVLTFHAIDRIAFVALVLAVAVRQVIARRRLPRSSLMVPMLALALLASIGTFRHSFEVSTWSVLAAKFFVPFAMFWMAGLVFQEERSLWWLEKFCFVVLGYLSFVSIVHLIGAYDLVFPRFILDESLGIHADRARGPFLQAVANGVTINMLGLLAIDGYCSRRLKGVAGMVLVAALPVAILATKTRAVWLSFAVSAIWLTSKLNDRRLRRTLLVVGMIGAFAMLVIVGSTHGGRGLGDRLEERSAVEFRIAAYHAGFEMFLERPLFGWGTKTLQEELARRIRGFRGESFAVHNTYFDVLLEQGVVGVGLYLWIVISLFRLGRRKRTSRDPVVASIHEVWLPLLAVYFVNATFVVMNYQFVNGLLFTCAGILAAHSSPKKHALELARVP